MKGKNYSVFGVVIASLLLSFLYCPPLDIYFDDKEIFKYAGFLIKNGEVPYKDFFDHKPPLIFFINFFGSLLGSWGLWLIDALLVLGVSLKFLYLNKKYLVCYPAILPILFNLLLRNNAISFGVGMTREYTTILLLLALCIVFSTSRYKFLYFGILTALTFFIQQEQVFILIPFLIYSVVMEMRQNQFTAIKIFTRFVAGILLVLLPVFLYFQINGALNDFWQNAFVFNTKWYTTEQKPGLIKQLTVLKNYVYELNFDILIISALIMGIVAFYIGHKRKILLVMGFIGLPLSLISEFLSAKLTIGNAACTYYFLPLAATLPFLFFIIFAFSEKGVFRNGVHQFIYGFILVASPFMNLAMYIANYHKYPQDWIAKSKEISYLNKKPVQDYQLYVFGNSNFIYGYNHFKVLPPSKWLYHYFWNWYPNWDKNGHTLQSIIADLQKHQTRYIIYDSSKMQFSRIGNKIRWENFLLLSYNQVPETNVYERR